MSSAEPPLLAPGTRLNGVFEIDWYVASGRLGDIYRANVVETGAAVAVKAMHAELAGSALALLRKEASALHDVHHEAIVRCYLFSHDPETGRHYLVMEFVDGQSLSALMQQGPLGSSAVHVLRERLAAGLEAAHQCGVIHRNLSPDSVLIPGRDLARAKIIGFGAAAGDGAHIGGGFAASNDYAAPEQFGLFGGEVTAKSDIYSLGLVFAACLCGGALDMGRTPLEVLEKRRTVPDLREIDRRFRPLLEQMLQPDPADRPESMAAVAAWRPPSETTALQRDAARGRGESAGPAALPETKAFTVIAAAVVLLLGVAGAGFYFASDRVSDLVSSWLAAPSNPEAVARKRADEPAPASQRRAVSSRQRIIEFVNAYDGGDCFFITPEAVGDDNAVLDGLSSSVAPFEILDYEFKRKNGFEPSIGVHQVMAEQCPAVSFLFHTRHQRSVAPRLDAVTAGLKEGGPLTGSISGLGAGTIELLLVADDGYVHNVTRLLKPSGSARNFTIGVRKTSPGPPRPQLLMAVASSRPLEALKVAPDGTLAGQVFPQALAEASRGGQTLGVSARYFMLEK
jgi:serine/threonine-protein kinase